MVVWPCLEHDVFEPLDLARPTLSQALHPSMGREREGEGGERGREREQNKESERERERESERAKESEREREREKKPRREAGREGERGRQGSEGGRECKEKVGDILKEEEKGIVLIAPSMFLEVS